MKKKVVIFGAWQEGINLYFEIRGEVDIVAFIDNNVKLQSQEIYGIKIISPNDIEQIKYDEIFISSSKQYQSMLVQLLALKVKRETIKIVFDTNKIKKDLTMTKNFLSYSIDNFEERWDELKRKHNKIMIYMLDMASIGETIIRLWKMIEDESLIGEGTLRVFIPFIGDKKRICNIELMKLASEKLHIVKDFEFWEYVLDVHKAEVECIDYNKYLYRDIIPHRIINREQVYINFRQSQIDLGMKNLSEMGIHGDYVCLAARSSDYAQSTLHDSGQMISNIEAHEYRNSDFNDYKETINYLASLGIQTVRMGRGEKPINSIENCIDYAGLYADDFMDIFLMANCRFTVVGGGSGIFSLATTFGRPVLFVNFIPLSFGNGGEAYMKDDMYIPKKVFCKRENRYLSLFEIASIERDCLVDGRKYSEKGIAFIDNTPEEILDAVKELMERMDNTWKDTEEDIQLYYQYVSVFSHIDKKAKKNIHNWTGGAMPRKISSSYLKKNLYLLDGGEKGDTE